ncbi:MAG: hypothetical protein QOK42_299 [Frankiaceae bacterium]|jgi:hypothetical protein|nr:hypothetical protein [Frankiaceae bacterium]MDX6225410.1 hypothetical protein [Frankiales bacterium]
MRRTVIALTALTALTSLAIGGANAATPKPKPVKVSCKVITDGAGDATYNNVPGSDSDDVVGGDIASNAQTMTVLIRTKALAYPDPQWAPGRVYSVSFTPKGSAYDEVFVAARTYPQGVQYILGHRAADPTSGINTSYKDADVTGSVTPASGEIRINVPMSALAKMGKIAKGTVIKGATAKVERILGQGAVPSQDVNGTRVPLGGLLLQFDISDGGSAYTLGAPSCTKVG